MFVWHRVQMLEQLRQQSNTIFPDQPGRLVPVLVIFKSMIDRQSGHSNVNSRLGWIALRITVQNRPILQRTFGEQDEVNVMMEFLVGGSKLSAVMTTHSLTSHLERAELYHPIARMIKTTLSILFLLLLPLALFAKGKAAPTKEKLAVSTADWTGKKLPAYPSGQPE